MPLIYEGCDELSPTKRLKTSSMRSANASTGVFCAISYADHEISHPRSFSLLSLGCMISIKPPSTGNTSNEKYRQLNIHIQLIIKEYLFTFQM